MSLADKINSFDPKISPYVPGIIACFEKFNINTPLRQAHFLAQICHESGHFKAVEENLNYSAGGLRKIFPKYFPTDALAAQYARQPAKIANRVYGGRMGNGPEASGDGFKYRGRSLLQCTGKNNYTSYSMDVYKDDRVVKDPDILKNSPDNVLFAGWFWNKNGINAKADKDDIVGVTRAINGGEIGLPDRKKLLAKAKTCLK